MEAERSGTAALGQRIVFGQPAPSRPASYRTVPPPDGQPILGASAGHLTSRQRGEGAREGRSLEGSQNLACLRAKRNVCTLF